MGDSKPKAAWIRMMQQLPTAMDPNIVRAQRGEAVLAPLPPHVNVPPPAVLDADQVSTSRKQLEAQAAFDAHMAEVARLQRLSQPAEQPAPAPSGVDDFDPSTYTTYKRP